MILKFLLCLRNSKIIGCIANVQISLGMLWITKMAILRETKSLSDLLFHETFLSEPLIVCQTNYYYLSKRIPSQSDFLLSPISLSVF